MKSSTNQLPETYVVRGRHFGVDEAGRGCMAGPLSIAAVEFPWDSVIAVKDSKRLTEKAREKLYEEIVQHCKYTCVFIDSEWIDTNGIQAAQTRGLLTVINTLAGWDGPYEDPNYPELVVADGTPGNWGLSHATLGEKMQARIKYMIKADKHVPAVSAASIVAKVSRDRFMADSMHTMYPAYDFDVHKGYVTPGHIAMLNEHGPSPIHRRSVSTVRDAIARAIE